MRPFLLLDVVQRIRANIGPSLAGAYPGVVVASPSPVYLFTWVRDAAIVIKSVPDLFDDFVHAESVLQHVGSSLGEPKFYVNETAFLGPWGRPQRDGPALRSSAIIGYTNTLLADGNTSHVTDTLWPVIQLDLDYVANNWNLSTFDLWEEVDSSSFFTTAVQHRALREGASLAATIDHPSVTLYASQADDLLCFLQSYWTPSPGFMTANTAGGRSGIDANSVLASIHTFDPNAGCDDTTFQPCSHKALSNLKAYVDAFRNIYRINFGIPANAAVATGRYPEDVYVGGNPWYLTTFAVAEQLYDALEVWNKQQSLTVTSTSLAFFRQFDTSLTTGTWTASSPTFSSLVTAIRNFADGFIAIAAQYTPSDGTLSEQYSRNDGTPLSASDLTWSYAASLSAMAARDGQTPPSWGAHGLSVPGACLTSDAQTVSVAFNINATTVLGENVYLTGSVSALHNWDVLDPILLSSANYPIWSTMITLPANTRIQYKYVRIYNGQVTWELDPNNVLTTGASGIQTLDDVWQ